MKISRDTLKILAEKDKGARSALGSEFYSRQELAVVWRPDGLGYSFGTYADFYASPLDNRFIKKNK